MFLINRFIVGPFVVNFVEHSMEVFEVACWVNNGWRLTVHCISVV